MHFDFLDRIVERTPERVVTLKAVTLAEEYLQDHFEGFEVLPGVFMLESLVHAARALIATDDPSCVRWVLGSARAVRYASFVRPGETLRCEAELSKHEERSATFKITGTAVPIVGETRACCTGRITLRPLAPISVSAKVTSPGSAP